jgi:hypothetical protein
MAQADPMASRIKGDVASGAEDQEIRLATGGFDPLDELMDKNEAAAFFRITVRTLEIWMRKGLPHYRIQRSIRFRNDIVEELKDHYRNGSLVVMCWHEVPPTSGRGFGAAPAPASEPDLNILLPQIRRFENDNRLVIVQNFRPQPVNTRVSVVRATRLHDLLSDQALAGSEDRGGRGGRGEFGGADGGTSFQVPVPGHSFRVFAAE